MKGFRLAGERRRLRVAAGLVAVFVSLFALAPAHADEQPLTDADIERHLPRLKAEAAAFTRQVREGRETAAAVGSALEEREKLLADMSSGKTNILEWMRSHAEPVPVSAGAVYSAECSRAVTAETRTPAAVFTFGKESPYRDLLRRAAAGDDAARDAFHARRGEEEMGERSAAGRETRAFVDGIVTSYHDHGFLDSEGPVISILTTVLLSPDRSVTALVSEANPYCGLLPRGVPPACSALPTGPVVELQFQGDVLLPPSQLKSSQKADVQTDTGSGAAGQGTGPAVEPGGGWKADPDYERVKEALILARTDAANPSAFEFEIPPDAPAEVRAEMASTAAEFAVRKANAAVYQRHQAVLEPILRAFLQLSEE
jgi:hypothetical protein